jgi:hypothetical protein
MGDKVIYVRAEDATSARRLRLDESQLTRCTLNGALDTRHVFGVIEIGPLEPEQLAAPQSHGQRVDEQCFEPVTAGSSEQALCLGEVESPTLGCLQRWWHRRPGDVARHESESLGVR